MLPRRDYRLAGTGGGGTSRWNTASTPFFCKICGRTVGRKQVQDSIDVCKSCRIKPARTSRKNGKKRK